MSKEAKIHSISLHLRRTIHEDCFVAVPVTEAILLQSDDGTASIHFEAFVAEAIRVSQSEGVDWQVEGSIIEPHPVQCPLPEGRRSFDDFYENQTDAD